MGFPLLPCGTDWRSQYTSLHTPLEDFPGTRTPNFDLHRSERWGSHRVVYHVEMHPSIMGRVIERHQVPLLRHLDQSTGEPVRAMKQVRQEITSVGELVHGDNMKKGGSADGGGHRVARRIACLGTNRNQRERGYSYLHQPMDSYQREMCAPRFWWCATALCGNSRLALTAAIQYELLGQIT